MMGRGVQGPFCGPGARMSLTCWRSEVCEMRRASVPGQSQNPGLGCQARSRTGPELSAAQPSTLFLQLLLKLSPLSSPSFPPSLPTMTDAWHASPWCRAFTYFPLPLLTLCLEVTFFVFKLGVEGIVPWLSKCFLLALKNPLGVAVGGDGKFSSLHLQKEN